MARDGWSLDQRRVANVRGHRNEARERMRNPKCCQRAVGSDAGAKIVTTVEDEAAHQVAVDQCDISRCTVVSKELVKPWARMGRIVSADSCIASVTTDQEVLRIGLKFFGVVYTATTQIPVAALSSYELLNRAPG